MRRGLISGEIGGKMDLYRRDECIIRLGLPILFGSIPDTWVTVRTGEMGYTTSGANGYSKGSILFVSKSKYPKS